MAFQSRVGRVAENFGREFWEEALAEFPATGLTVAQFCARQGCSVPTFYAWRQRLGESQHRPAPSFTELIVEDRSDTNSVIEIQLDHGTSLRLTGSVDEVNLRTVLRVLGESAC
jgi:transposase-like protein